MTLFEDWFDMMELTRFAKEFPFFESTLQERLNPKKLAVKDYKISCQVCLRICNRLLQRLSGTRDAEQRGKVLQLMAYVHSIDDRSGLNIKGTFHVENVTKVDHESLDEYVSAHPAFDKKFYLELWELQDFFVNPPGLSKDLKKQKRLLELVKSVFASFNAKAVLKESENQSISEDFFDFPKYLTSPSIFHLQMQDGTFRKQILIQVLILFQYLRVNSKKVPLELDSTTVAAVPEIEAEAKNLLIQCFPAHSHTLAEILIQLDREDVWMKYKDNGCNPEMVKEPAPLSIPERPVLTSLDKRFQFKIKQQSEFEESIADHLENDGIALKVQANIEDEREFAKSLSEGSKHSWRSLRGIRNVDLNKFNDIMLQSIKLIESGKLDNEEDEIEADEKDATQETNVEIVEESANDEVGSQKMDEDPTHGDAEISKTATNHEVAAEVSVLENEKNDPVNENSAEMAQDGAENVVGTKRKIEEISS